MFTKVRDSLHIKNLERRLGRTLNPFELETIDNDEDLIFELPNGELLIEKVEIFSLSQLMAPGVDSDVIETHAQAREFNARRKLENALPKVPVNKREIPDEFDITSPQEFKDRGQVEYFQQVDSVFCQYPFKSKTDELIMDLHREGLNCREIEERLKEIRTAKSLSFKTVSRRIDDLLTEVGIEKFFTKRKKA